MPALVLALGAGGCAGQPAVELPVTSGPVPTAVPAVQVDSEVDQTRTRGYQELVERAVVDVEQLWGTGSVARPVRLVLPGSDAAFAAATGLTEGTAEVPAAVVGTGGAARVVVHPDAWDRLSEPGRRAVLTHEVAHLAMDSHGPVPAWLAEGMAEFTAHRGSRLPVATIAGSALDPVRAGELPQGWPEPGAGERWHGYAMAWLACHYLAEQHSPAQLMDLYLAVAGGTAVADAIPDTLGISEEQALAGWRDWLVELAG